MKLYVLPIGSLCNARCAYCITKFRKIKNKVLDPNKLIEILAVNKFDRIEITGGGEPSLHPQIDQIVEICSAKCPTNIYTNGNYSFKTDKVQICLSRAHYNDIKNEEIMGVKYDINKYSRCNDMKLSLILHKNGISTLTELLKYLKWAKKFAKKVVVRQLFEYENTDYGNYFIKQYVSSVDLAEKLGKIYPMKFCDGSYFFKIDNLEVEFEGRSCACEDDNPVLGSDGITRKGWANL